MKNKRIKPKDIHLYVAPDIKREFEKKVMKINLETEEKITQSDILRVYIHHFLNKTDIDPQKIEKEVLKYGRL